MERLVAETIPARRRAPFCSQDCGVSKKVKGEKRKKRFGTEEPQAAKMAKSDVLGQRRNHIAITQRKEVVLRG
jgi:hypothetical protein